MRNFRDLKVGERSLDFAVEVYAATGSFPPSELFGLTGQLRRAATSIGSNIAEGCGRDSDADFARMLSIAAGSASEVEFQLLLASRLGYVDPARHAAMEAQVKEIRKMLHALIQRFRRQP